MDEEIKTRLKKCEEALVFMVQQYCHWKDDEGNDKYSHWFMAAGEAAFDYLLMYGLAAPDPNPNHQEDIVFVEAEG